MSEIRIGYSGLISLIIGLVSTILGMIFVLIVTRTVLPQEYGSWGLISGFLIYAGIIEPMISIWVLREVARGTKSGKTAIISGGLFSIIGILIYFVTVIIIGSQTDAELNLLYFGALLIPAIFLNRIMTAINSAWKPQVASYGQLIFGITEVLVAFFLIYLFNMGLVGIILTVTVAFLASGITQIIFGKKELREKFMLKYLKKWFKLSWISLYPTISGSILYFDVAIFSIISGSVMGLSYWSAALAISGMISGVGLITRASYSKLLFEGNKSDFISDNLRQLFYFGFPAVSLVIVFAKPGIYILNPIYEIAIPVVSILSIQVFLGVVNRNFLELVTGVEEVDTIENSSFKDFLKSKLFLMPTVLLLKNSTYVILLAVGLLVFISDTLSEQLLFWAILSLVAQVPFTIYSYILMRKEISFIFNYSNVLKYFIISLGCFGISYFLMDSFLEYSSNLFVLISRLVPYVIFSFGSYLSITYLVDKNTRILIKAIIHEMKK